jgi:hypothetical protein
MSAEDLERRRRVYEAEVCSRYGTSVIVGADDPDVLVSRDEATKSPSVTLSQSMQPIPERVDDVARIRPDRVPPRRGDLVSTHRMLL